MRANEPGFGTGPNETLSSPTALIKPGEAGLNAMLRGVVAAMVGVQGVAFREQDQEA